VNPWRRARDVLRPIHRTPADWRDACVHHGFRAILVVLIAVAIPWLFPRSNLPQFEGLTLGSVADRDVIAAVQFPIMKSGDVLADERREAEDATSIILARDETQADSSIAHARALFVAMDSAAIAARAEGGEPAEVQANEISALAEVAEDHGVAFPREQLVVLADDGQRDRVRDALLEAFDGPLRRGVIRTSELADAGRRAFVLREGGRDQVLAADTIHTMQRFFADATGSARQSLSPPAADLFNALAIQFARATLMLDSEAIRQARQQARDAVPESEGLVVEGERIVTQHELIGEREAQLLASYQTELVQQGLVGAAAGFWQGLGMVLLAGGVLGLLVFTTYTFRREIYEDLRSFTVLLFLIVLVLGASGVVSSTGISPALVPVAFAALLVAGLFDAFLAIVVVSAIAGILLGQTAFEGLPAPMLIAAGGVTAAFAVREVRRRSQSWVLIALITAAYIGTAICLALIGKLGWTEVLVTSAAGFGNATLCTALAMGAVLPALESFTGRTTGQTLLELADMNRPLLRRLAREAPGTYSHSINMANLVEAACEATGADALLARVGVYYHDIGKLSRPQYFIENQPAGLNPHDRLQPIQSAEILRAHVRDGLALADEARLPRVVKDFIREHHGTQRIDFFLHKAKEAEPGRDIDPNDFCYSGPKPQTRETAIAMLADAVESASRTLKNPSPERIRELIQKLTQKRVDDGQLDECGLTFRDLDRIKREFAHVLTGLYHHRIDYPEPHAAVAPGVAGAAEVTIPPPSTTAGPAAELGFPTGPVGAPGPEQTGRLSGPDGRSGPRADAEQMSIDLTQAAQSDTGPPPELDDGGSTEPRDTIPLQVPESE